VDKKDNAAGLQIADLVVTPIGRWAMGKKAHEDWEIIKKLNFVRTAKLVE